MLKSYFKQSKNSFQKDYGVVEETCNEYKGVDGICHSYDTNCTRHYATNYRYIGGFYGGCNEPLMRIALVKNGPLAVSFQVYDDFLNYKGGIYHHTNQKDIRNFKFNPWEVTNHVGNL
jgi:cathepsin C